MKMITLENLLQALKEDIYHVTVPEETAQRARKAIDRMVSIY
jgi:quinolinate synthase